MRELLENLRVQPPHIACGSWASGEGQSAQVKTWKNRRKNPKFHFAEYYKKETQHENIAKELSYQRSHLRNSSIDH